MIRLKKNIQIKQMNVETRKKEYPNTLIFQKNRKNKSYQKTLMIYYLNLLNNLPRINQKLAIK